MTTPSTGATGGAALLDTLAAELAVDGEPVTEALDAWSVRTPLRVFIHYGEHGLDLSYAEARRATDTIAGNLEALGIGRGDRVAVHCRSPYAAALWMFGIWKAGAIFCPVDPDLIGQPLLDQLTTIAPAIIVTERMGLSSLELVRRHLPYAPPVTVHDSVGVLPPHGFPEVPYAHFLARALPPQYGAAPEDIAAIVHTPGNTGRPKAVVLCHRYIAQSTFLLRRLTTPDDVVYNDLPMHTILGAFAGVARAAWTGSMVTLWDRFHPGEFWSRITATGASTAVLTDAAVPWLTSAPERPGDAENALAKVWLHPLPATHADFARRFGIDYVIASYGQIETGMPVAVVIEELGEGAGTPVPLQRGLTHEQVTRVCSHYRVPVVPGQAVPRKGLLGAPLPFLEVAVLDEYDRRVGPGVVGELAVRPHLPGLVVQEYLNDALSTAEATRNLWLHTGDAVVRSTEDGLLHFVDRVQDRIRMRGENISAYHIEDLVNQHPDIAICAVFGVSLDGRQDDDIVLYVEPDPGRLLDRDALQAWCGQSLPPYMRPAHIRVVVRMPRTPNHRVEKHRLRRHFLGLPDPVGAIVEQTRAPVAVPRMALPAGGGGFFGRDPGSGPAALPPGTGNGTGF
ncbi:class I adenylate-forming enzyme family protein [Yinghuangia soli]|uniref:AMP-binding protein n=1 Tax=Yinghuangia soli TaxID=2908204 RepID=A0AA41PV23_9ACTN|nr:AMP-binding protein [Yinghuangia soli]MCF2525741.1 AMP-binding protein [Yinghuangia soli]